VFDFTPWLAPIEDTNPSGKELNGEPRFDALVRMARTRADAAQNSRDADPVDWAAVLGEAEFLRGEGRDLRLLVVVARALVNEQGFDGLADGLTLIARTLEAHWDTLFPRLGSGPNPRDAAQRRVSALLMLEMDREGDGLLADLRRRAVFGARGAGPVTGRDLERAAVDSRVALGEAASGKDDRERAEFVAAHDQLVARVAAACAAHAEQARAEMAALLAGIGRASEALAALETALAARLGVAMPFKDLGRSLARMRIPLERAAKPAAEPVPAEHEAPPAEAGLGAGASLASASATAPAVPPGRLATRQEVVACLDRIIEFYDRTEPASPVPFLARRMRRMVPMDFLELMEDLAPSGLKEFRSLAGLSDDKKAPRTTG
jgi:type VI secretion system protein ImpA